MRTSEFTVSRQFKGLFRDYLLPERSSTTYCLGWQGAHTAIVQGYYRISQPIESRCLANDTPFDGVFSQRRVARTKRMQSVPEGEEAATVQESLEYSISSPVQ